MILLINNGFTSFNAKIVALHSEVILLKTFCDEQIISQKILNAISQQTPHDDPVPMTIMTWERPGKRMVLCYLFRQKCLFWVPAFLKRKQELFFILFVVRVGLRKIFCKNL